MEENIYFTADTHFWHTNVIKYCNRPFSSVEEMNEVLIKKWNETVGENDIIYHLGDVAFCSKEQLKVIIERLNGKKYLIRGNHDTRSPSVYEDMGFTVLRNPPIKIDKYKLVLSHTPRADTEFPKDYVNVHGHIHEKPLHVINMESEGVIEKYPKNLYTINKHICVCVDVTDFKPISLKELLDKIERFNVDLRNK